MVSQLLHRALEQGVRNSCPRMSPLSWGVSPRPPPGLASLGPSYEPSFLGGIPPDPPGLASLGPSYEPFPGPPGPLWSLDASLHQPVAILTEASYTGNTKEANPESGKIHPQERRLIRRPQRSESGGSGGIPHHSCVNRQIKFRSPIYSLQQITYNTRDDLYQRYEKYLGSSKT
jgi:hypothetical protein